MWKLEKQKRESWNRQAETSKLEWKFRKLKSRSVKIGIDKQKLES